ncbi:hypothetical protein BV22DRAFT_1049074 [Leucogyrophana mollusca]|uniref:Uncharacterized protein n=1 Tax=Leucogyrophana mollusca TaxID=85980 RepID=A0ACB8BA62_9AGAM|nr:hypothetical protein BV22DRAFT_1049074 [Leucogyrophana mollusca]
MCGESWKAECSICWRASRSSEAPRGRKGAKSWGNGDMGKFGGGATDVGKLGNLHGDVRWSVEGRSGELRVHREAMGRWFQYTLDDSDASRRSIRKFEVAAKFGEDHKL